jgi:hypothetical protein
VGFLLGSAVLAVIGVALIAPAPAKSAERVSAAVAQVRTAGTADPDIPGLKETKLSPRSCDNIFTSFANPFH